MVAAGVAGLLMGYGLGLRFRVTVLIPVELAALVASLAAALAGTVGGGTAFLGFALFSLALQAGYAAGLALPLPARPSGAASRLEA